MLGRVLFTQELAERVKGKGIAVNAVHPGLVGNTRLLEQTGGFFRWLTNTFGATPEKGADTVLWLATSPEAAKESGKLWSRRKPFATPGQGSDPEARRRFWEACARLTKLA
jgi:NAD(P)-dependent dehydrogenase (short-subunit alcohol dehydrogenase family)